MSDEFTPGEWEIVRVHGDILGVGVAMEGEEHGCYAMLCNSLALKSMRKIDEANFALISAAPDLLAALRSKPFCPSCRGRGAWETNCTLCGDSTYDHVCNDKTVSCKDCEATGLGNLARAAIAKATGKAEK